jgi:hypothetical protein
MSKEKQRLKELEANGGIQVLEASLIFYVDTSSQGDQMSL